MMILFTGVPPIFLVCITLFLFSSMVYFCNVIDFHISIIFNFMLNEYFSRKSVEGQVIAVFVGISI